MVPTRDHSKSRHSNYYDTRTFCLHSTKIHDYSCFTLNESQLAETVRIIKFIYLKTKKTVKLKMFSKNAYPL